MLSFCNSHYLPKMMVHAFPTIMRLPQMYQPYHHHRHNHQEKDLQHSIFQPLGIIIQNHCITRKNRWNHCLLFSFSPPPLNGPKSKKSNDDAEAREQRARRRNENNPNNRSYKGQHHRRNNNNMRKNNRQNNNRRHRLTPAEIHERTQRAMDVEQRLTVAIDKMHRLLDSDTDGYRQKRNSKEGSNNEYDYNIEIPSFPSVRECNAALASIGDTGDFKRAIRMFGAMRKASQQVSKYQHLSEKTIDDNEAKIKVVKGRVYIRPPSPTLVTYSTLMSRAVALGEESVALRLWRLMTLEKNFYTNIPHSSLSSDKNYGDDNFGAPIVPDIKAVNILMNVFAKLADTRSADLLMKQLHLGESGFDPLLFVEKIEKRDDDIDAKMASGYVRANGGSLDIEGLIRVVPKIDANIVTFNTYIDACHRAGDLDVALEALHFLKTTPPIKPNNRLKQPIQPLRPDLRTYTSLISTVARRTTRSSGARDPDLAFSLLDEMVNTMKIIPNGMTYCALIDVCGRCHRVDLALKGLRMMLRQKASTKREKNDYEAKSGIDPRRQNLYNEVGAWTSAIKACGRAGRLDTAIRLFHTMQKFGAKPNTVTCGCLTDCMLKSNDYEKYIDETVRVMRYMKDEGLEPSEVMYTSLMSAATRLAKKENKRKGKLVLLDIGDSAGAVDLSFDSDRDDNDSSTLDNSNDGLKYRSSGMMKGDITDNDTFVQESAEAERTKALEIYTELILSLASPAAIKSYASTVSDVLGGSTRSISKTNGSASARNTSARQSYSATKTVTTNIAPTKEANALLLKVFLVFQEMKASGSDPDLACYNAILKACACAGDTERLMEVMERIQGDGFHPNDTSWREMLRGAANAGRSDFAEKIWEMALECRNTSVQEGGSNRGIRYRQHGKECWVPNSDAFELLISAYIRHGSTMKNKDARAGVLSKVIQAYVEVVEGNDKRGLHHVNVDLLKKNQRLMSMVLKSAISLEKITGSLHDSERGSFHSDCYTFSQEKLRAIIADISVDLPSINR